MSKSQSTSAFSSEQPQYYLGCPMWNMPEWQGTFLTRSSKPQERLAEYSSVFTSVEGNTSFYGMPKLDTLKRWYDEAHSQFRFCLKLPKTITHEGNLLAAKSELTDFYKAIAHLGEKMGLVHIQLPPTLSSSALSELEKFLPSLSQEFTHCLEVRHLDFFDKADNEKRLNRLLLSDGINRTCFDSRPLFKAEPTTPSIVDAQRKKPRLPVHAYAVADQPMVRFISHPVMEDNIVYLEQWAKKVALWIEEGKTPYVFMHTASNINSPFLARLFHQMLSEHLNSLMPLAEFPAEIENAAQLSFL